MSSPRTRSITITPKTSGDLTIKGGKRLERWVRNARHLRNEPVAEAGFFKTSRYRPDRKRRKRRRPYVAQIAYLNEFGSENIPERPFFRRAIDVMEGKFPSLVLRHLNIRIMRFRSGFWNRVGEMAEDEIKEGIEAFSNPPNAPRTIARKGYDNPLQETDFMWKSVKSRVAKK